LLLRFSGYVDCDHKDNRAATATTAVDGAAAADETAAADGATDWGTTDLLPADWAAAADLADRAAVDQRGAEVGMPDLVGDYGGSASNKMHKPAIAVFFSNTGLYTMKNAHEINVDGTFSSCPSPFKQLIFIQAKQAGQRPVPVAFALLTNKVH
jgi:hypothetical protein